MTKNLNLPKGMAWKCTLGVTIALALAMRPAKN